MDLYLVSILIYPELGLASLCKEKKLLVFAIQMDTSEKEVKWILDLYSKTIYFHWQKAMLYIDVSVHAEAI